MTAPHEQPVEVRGARSVVGDLTSLMGARMGSALLSLMSAMVTTRLLLPEEYARLAFVSVLAMLVFSTSAAWSTAAVVRYARERLETHHNMAVITWSRVVFVAPVFVVAALVVCALKLAGALPPGFSWTLVWVSLAYSVALVVSDHVTSLLEADGRIKFSAAGLFLQQFAIVGALVALYVTGTRASALLIAVISVAAAVLVTIAFCAAVWRVGVRPLSFEPAMLRRLLMLSIPLIAFTLSQYVVRWADFFFIGLFSTTAQVGVYAIAYQGFTLVQQVTAAAGPVITPLLVSLRVGSHETAIARYFSRFFPQLTLAGGALLGVAVPFVALAVPIVFGDAFAGAVKPLELLFIALLLTWMSQLLLPLLVLHERTKSIAMIALAAATVNVAGDLALIPFMGSSGAALATALGLAVLVAGYATVARRAVGARTRMNPLLVAPFAAGLLPVLLLPALSGAAVGFVSAILATAAVLVVARPFSSDDADTLARLDMPAGIRDRLIRFIRLVS